MTGKRFFILSAAVLFTSVSVWAQDTPAAVAEVNGVEINSSDVKREMNIMYQQAVQLGQYPDNSEIDEYWNTALNTLIGRELLFQDAVEHDYKADSSQVDDYINALIQNYGSEDALVSVLAQQDMTLERLKNDTERYDVISQYVDNELSPQVSVSEQDAADYYERNKDQIVTEETVRASHILIALAQDASEAETTAALEKISALRERIIAGEDFADIAREYSEGPTSVKGGDLGEFGRGTMVPPFEQAVFALEVGEVSRPVRTQFGYHLIKLTAKSEAGIIPYEDVKMQIMQYLSNVALNKLVNDYVADLRTTAEVNIF